MKSVKVCPDGKILNPSTNRCVNKNGKIGMAILSAKPKSAKPKSTKIKKIDIISYGCNKIGMTQTIGTCWFNAIFNNLLLSQNCYSFFTHKYNELSIDEKKIIENKNKSFHDTCPLKIKKYHFFRYFYLYNKAISNPKNFISKIHRIIKTRKHAENLINNLEIRETGWKKNHQGFDPFTALTRILPIILNKNEYIITQFNKKIKATNTLRFIFLEILQYTISYTDINTIENKAHLPENFKLDHANIIVDFKTPFTTKSLGHAFSGYICDNEYYIYDSNFSKYFKVDWRKTDNIAKHFEKEYSFCKTEYVGYSYICYMRM